MLLKSILDYHSKLTDLLALGGWVAWLLWPPAATAWLTSPLGLAGYGLLLLGLFVICRRRAGAESWQVWMSGWLLSILPLVGFRSAEITGWNWILAGLFQFSGLSGMAIVLINLPRAANGAADCQGRTTDALYGMMRHLLYTYELLWALGYCLAHPVRLNWMVWLLCLVVQVMRIGDVEAAQAKHPIYQGYCRRVRWRLLAGLW